MNIALWTDSHNFPSLPCMKLSAHHKSRGDRVEWWQPQGSYDIAYISKVFTESAMPEITNAQKVIRGGSGIDLKNKLPEDIEHTTPDYSLYPQHDFALGFLTRGCPRINHSYCITPHKDGTCARKVADLSEFWAGQKDIVLLDQNLLACKDRIDLIGQLAESKARVEFNGGLDVRFVDSEVIAALRRVRVKDYHFAWDDPQEDLYSSFERIAQSGLLSPGATGVYVLTNYWSTTEEDLHRVYALRGLGYMPYVMIYDKQQYVDGRGRWLPQAGSLFTPAQLRHFKVCQYMQRWANNRAIIKSCPHFEDYGPYRQWIHNGMPLPMAQTSLAGA